MVSNSWGHITFYVHTIALNYDVRKACLPHAYVVIQVDALVTGQNSGLGQQKTPVGEIEGVCVFCGGSCQLLRITSSVPARHRKLTKIACCSGS